MTGLLVPGSGEVVRHQVPEVEVLVHGRKIKHLELIWASWRGDGKLEVVRCGAVDGNGTSVDIKCLTDGLEEGDIVLPLLGVGRVLPVDVDTVESQISDKANTCAREPVATCLSGCWGWKVVGVRPSSDRHEELQVTVLALEKVDLLEAAIHVVADIVPGVRLIMLVCVGPGIGQIAET